MNPSCLPTTITWLFLTFFSHLSCDIHYLFFADDTILTKGSNSAETLKDAAILFEIAKNWFKANKMKLNEDKT